MLDRLIKHYVEHGNYLDLNDPRSPWYFGRQPQGNPILKQVPTNNPGDFRPNPLTIN